MRILVSSDLHGHQILYDDLATLTAEHRPDVTKAWSQRLGRTPVRAALIDVDGARQEAVEARALGM